MNYIDGQFVPIDGVKREESSSSSNAQQQTQRKNQKSAGGFYYINDSFVDVNGKDERNLDLDTSVSSSQDEYLKVKVAEEIKKHLSAFKKTQQERFATVESRITDVEARLKILEGATNNHSKHEVEEIRLELSSLQREFHSNKLNIQEPTNQDPCDGSDSNSKDTRQESKNLMENNPLYVDLIDKNKPGTPTLSDLYSRTEQLGQQLKLHGGLKSSNQARGSYGGKRGDRKVHVSPPPKPATPPFTNPRKVPDYNQEDNQSVKMSSGESYARAVLNDRIYNVAFNTGRAESASHLRPESASDRNRSRERANDVRIVSIANVKFNEPIEPTEFREVTPMNKHHNTRPISSRSLCNTDRTSADDDLKNHPEQQEIDILDGRGSNEKGGIQSGVWLLENDEWENVGDDDGKSGASTKSPSDHQYQRIINNALRPSSSNSLRFKIQLKGNQKKNSKQRYLVFPPKASARFEDFRQDLGQEMEVMSRLKSDRGIQERVYLTMDALNHVKSKDRGNITVTGDRQPNNHKFGEELPPNYPRPSSSQLNGITRKIVFPSDITQP